MGQLGSSGPCPCACAVLSGLLQEELCPRGQVLGNTCGNLPGHTTHQGARHSPLAPGSLQKVADKPERAPDHFRIPGASKGQAHSGPPSKQGLRRVSQVAESLFLWEVDPGQTGCFFLWTWADQLLSFREKGRRHQPCNKQLPAAFSWPVAWPWHLSSQVRVQGVSLAKFSHHRFPTHIPVFLAELSSVFLFAFSH